jgi:drug/metabolite transporter (DMT)-like permease
MRIPAPLAFVLCTLIWGTTWLAIKIGYGGLDAVWGAALRFLGASFLLILLMAFRRIPFSTSRRHVALVAFVGLVLFGLDYGLIYWGEQYLPSGLTSILFATMPLFVAFFAAIIIPSERMTLQHGMGILLGLTGLFVIFEDDLRGGFGHLGPFLAIVSSAAAAAVSGVAVRRWGRDLAPVSLNAGAMLVGGLALTAASLLLGEHPSLPATPRSWASVFYLILFGSILSFLLYWDLLKQWTAHRAGLIPIVTPVVAVLTGLFVGERLTLLQWLGSTIVLLGVAVSLTPMEFKRPTPQGASPK